MKLDFCISSINYLADEKEHAIKRYNATVLLLYIPCRTIMIRPVKHLVSFDQYIYPLVHV